MFHHVSSVAWDSQLAAATGHTSDRLPARTSDSHPMPSHWANWTKVENNIEFEGTAFHEDTGRKYDKAAALMTKRLSRRAAHVAWREAPEGVAPCRKVSLILFATNMLCSTFLVKRHTSEDQKFVSLAACHLDQ